MAQNGEGIMHQRNDKTNKIAGLILSVVFCLCIFVGGLYTCIACVTYDDAFYSAQYEKYHVDYTTAMTQSELMRVVNEVQLFLSGERADFDIWGDVAGVYGPLFNEQEQFHMMQVRALYLDFAVVRNVAAALMCAAVILAVVLKKRCVWRSLIKGSLAALCAAAVIGIASAVSFNSMFTLFHKLFFDNNLWLFDLNTSMLVNIFPDEFFMAAALRIFIAFGLLCAVFCLIGYMMQKITKRSRNGQGHHDTCN